VGDAELGRVLESAYALLREGAAEPGSSWRLMSLATMRADGGPAIRTVVLRGFDAGQRIVDIHTDRRSHKCAELRRQAGFALHGWDRARRVQLRLSGTAVVLESGRLADAAWAAMPPHARAQYGVLPGPGTRLRGPDYAMHDPDEAAARAVFAVLRLVFDQLEWLSLPEMPGQGVHKRALFRWRGGAAEQDWLVP
jgi:hypothetical protein